ncbi:hypothetical protein CAEBREN_00511 [Caenorhabditis brenneri]|uniref:Uncharacterized protein n=1 Tax=Caenorhabditis brenneri TaxID=135651 RepID=G0P2S6_CAEBE|nr:hypothetical protein CAEBREN_00511 [Caenorhabditis brenneri]
MPNTQSKPVAPPSVCPPNVKPGQSYSGRKFGRMSDQEAANLLLLYPSMDTYWAELTIRRKEMNKPELKKWFWENAIYIPEKRGEDEFGVYTNKMSCAVCSNNWAGWPVTPHSGEHCPIPMAYQQFFLATNTPATCQSCFGRVEWHEKCKRAEESNRYCYKCESDGKGKRNHVPLSRICNIPTGKEKEVFDEYRRKYYQHVVDISKKAPLKLKLVNDSPIKPRTGVQVKLYGIPPLTDLDLPKPTYAEGAEYAGLVGCYQTVEREVVTSQIVQFQKVPPSTPLFPPESPEKHKFYEIEPSDYKGGKDWDELGKDCDTYWTATTDHIESYEKSYKNVQDISSDISGGPENEDTWNHGAYRKRELFEKLFYETYMHDESIVTRIQKIQKAVTGAWEMEVTIQENLIEKNPGWLIPYYEFVRDLAMILYKSQEIPLVLLQPHHLPYVSWNVNVQGNTVLPSTKAYLNSPVEVRFAKTHVFLCKMAAALKKKQ